MSKQDSRTQIGSRIDSDLYYDFKVMCARRKVDIREAIERLIRQALQKAKKDGK